MIGLPHHRRRPIFARLRCLFARHSWRPFDLYSDECIWCGAKREMPHRGLVHTHDWKQLDAVSMYCTSCHATKPAPGKAREYLEQRNQGARMADDRRCECCGKRGVWGRYCQSCESSR